MVCVEYGNMGSWSTIDEMIAEYSTVSTKQNKRNKREHYIEMKPQHWLLSHQFDEPQLL